MDEIKLHEEEIKIEDYFEEKKVYELFKNLMKDLVVHRPEDPLDFLVERLGKPKPKRIFITGNTGANRKEVGLSIADHFGATCISMGDILTKEVNKKSEHGKVIQQCKKKYQFVPDDIAVELLKPHIRDAEASGKDWIVEGFPRTQTQAVSMQRLGIAADLFFHIPVSEQTSLIQVKNNLIAANTTLYGPELD